MKIDVLYEDESLIVAVKPVGIESQSARSFEPDMVSAIKNILALKGAVGEEGGPYVGVVHRLDKPVGGVMVYAKTKTAAAALSLAVQRHEVEKTYLAVVCGKLVDKSGTYVDYLWKDGKTNTSKIVDKRINGAKRAELSYRVVDEIVDENVDDVDNRCGQTLSLVEIYLKTGRHHQIRVQFAGHGTPLAGDLKYGGSTVNAGRGNGRGGQAEQEVGQAGRGAIRVRQAEHVALYAYRLAFLHPVTGERLVFSKMPENPPFSRFQMNMR